MQSKPLRRDLQIYRYANGVKLVDPAVCNMKNSPQYGQKTDYTVDDVLKLPFNFYFLDTEGKTEIMNEESAIICGFESAADSIGKSLFDVSEEESARNLINNCSEVINENTVKIFEEDNTRSDGMSVHFLSIKSPWYDEHNTIMGVFGCSIVLGKHGLAASLSSIVQLGLFYSDHMPVFDKTNLNINKTYLSKREMDCLYLTIKGYTAKKIARELQISHRTVEEYLVNIRMKKGASSKAELIEMTVNEFIQFPTGG